MSKLAKIIIGILCLVTVTAIGYGVYEHYQRDKSEQTTSKQIASAQKTVNTAAKIIASTDNQGRNHATISADSNQAPHNWYDNGTALAPGFIDSMTRALLIKKDQLQDALQVASTTAANNLKAQKELDSLKRLTYYYKDKYLQLAYRPARAGDTTDNGEFDFRYNDSLNVVQYWKKSWLLGAKKSFIDIFSNDPRTTVNGVKRMVVQQNEPAFGLRVQAVSNYSFSRKQFIIGPGLQFDFKRFSLIGTYYYDSDSKLFRPSIGARYDIIRF